MNEEVVHVVEVTLEYLDDDAVLGLEWCEHLSQYQALRVLEEAANRLRADLAAQS